MSVPAWQPGKQYLPGDIVRPTGQGDVGQDELANPDFEAGDTGWTFSGGGSDDIGAVPQVFSGVNALHMGATSNPNGGTLVGTNDNRLPATPGQVVTLRCFARAHNSGSDPSRFQLRIQWYNAADAELGSVGLPLDSSTLGGQPRVVASGIISFALRDQWIPLETQGVAPFGAASWTAKLEALWGDDQIFVDDVTVVYASIEEPITHLFRATQAEAGFSGQSEPDWPGGLGATIVDNEVTWTAIAGNNITWQANRILISGATEPTFPTTAGSSVVDGSIAWELETRRVRDTNAPQSTLALIGASKVFAPDGDIIAFSATVNPLDWTTADDAGYLPFGLQEHGANPVTAMGLYRGNLAAFNTQGCQIWQIDEDPTGMTILDAIPVSCRWPKSVQPVGDDLAFLSSVGIRELGASGASVNLQGGFFGKQIDPLVQAALAEAIANGWTPRGLYWPARGQYWLFFDDEAFVLTVHGSGTGKRSWSRYTFPWAVDAWTLRGDDLYLRAGDLVLKVSETATLDDQRQESGVTVGTEFESVLHWPHMDLERSGRDKHLTGLDLQFTGTARISLGYDQRTQEYSVGGPWTAEYEVAGDTLVGQPLPIELTAPSFALRMAFDSDQAWSFDAANLYVSDREGR